MWDQAGMMFEIHGCCFVSVLCLSLNILVTRVVCMFLILRNADSPLGRFLKDEVNAAKNIYSFGFGKVRCYG